MRNRSWRDVRAKDVKGRVGFAIPYDEIGPADQKPPIRARRQKGAGAVEAVLIHAGGGRWNRTPARSALNLAGGKVREAEHNTPLYASPDGTLPTGETVMKSRPPSEKRSVAGNFFMSRLSASSCESAVAKNRTEKCKREWDGCELLCNAKLTLPARPPVLFRRSKRASRS
jgi:hypothetical protein